MLCTSSTASSSIELSAVIVKLFDSNYLQDYLQTVHHLSTLCLLQSHSVTKYFNDVKMSRVKQLKQKHCIEWRQLPTSRGANISGTAAVALAASQHFKKGSTRGR